MASSKPYPPKPAAPASAGAPQPTAPRGAPKGKPAPIITDYASL